MRAKEFIAETAQDPVYGQLTEFDPGPDGFGPFKVYYEQDYFIDLSKLNK